MYISFVINEIAKNKYVLFYIKGSIFPRAVRKLEDLVSGYKFTHPLF